MQRAKVLRSNEPQGAALPTVGWPRPRDARLVRAGQGPREWVVVDFALDDRAAYDTAGLLARFLRLSDARPRQILAFARRYGVPLDPQGASPPFPREGGNYWGIELAALRQYSSVMDAALSLQRRVETKRAYVVQGDSSVRRVREFLREHGSPADRIRELRHPHAADDVPRVGPAELPRWWVLQRHRVTGVVNWWLERGKVHPCLVVLPNGRLAERWTGGLWGVLGGQLLYAVRRETNVAICDYCGQEFRLSRRPREGARVRCCMRPACQRAYRADRMRQARAAKRKQG